MHHSFVSICILGVWMDYLFYQNPRYIERMDSDDLYELTLDFQVPLVTTVTFKIYLKNTVSSLWCTHRQKKISSLTFYGIIIKWLRYRCKYKLLDVSYGQQKYIVIIIAEKITELADVGHVFFYLIYLFIYFIIFLCSGLVLFVFVCL